MTQVNPCRVASALASAFWPDARWFSLEEQAVPILRENGAAITPAGRPYENRDPRHPCRISPDPTTKVATVPIYQTTSYAFDDTQHGADLFDLKVAGNIYTRIMNPTSDVLEKRVAAMEGGVGALALASGMAASHLFDLHDRRGRQDIIVASPRSTAAPITCSPTPCRSTASGEVRATIASPAFGSSSTRRPRRSSASRSAIRPATSRISRAIADIAHRHGAPLIVDNTVPTPYLCRPFEHGADIVMHSLTKYIGGHGTTIGGHRGLGQVSLGGACGELPPAEQPDVSYHGRGLHGGARPGRLHRPCPGGAAAQYGRGDLARSTAS